MKDSKLLLWLSVMLALVLAAGGLFYWLDQQRIETERNALASLDAGIALFREKRYQESLETLQAIPDGALQDWHLHYYTASALVMLKDYESAVLEYEEALALNPDEPLILFALGVNYFKLGNLALSKSYFAAVLEIDPDNAEAKGLMDIMANLQRQQAEPEGGGTDASEPELEPVD